MNLKSLIYPWPPLGAILAWVAVAVLSSVTISARADDPPGKANDDCPMWGCSPSRNCVNTRDKNVPIEWSTEKGQWKNIKWMARLGQVSYGGPVIAGGKIFVGTNNDVPRDPAVKGDRGIVMCFRQEDGQFLWQTVHEFPANLDQQGRNQGIASSPAVDGNRVYYVSNACELVCADAAPETKERIIWRLDMMKELNVFPDMLSNCSPLVAGDLVFVCTSNGVDARDGEAKIPEPEAPSFIAVNKKTGQVVWKDNSPGKNILEGQWSSPAYAVVNGKAQVIFGGGDGWVRGFEADTGKPIWKFDCNPKATAYKPGGRGDRNYIVATPVVHENKVYMGVGLDPEFGSGVGHLWCIDITKTGDLSPVNDNFDPKAPENQKSGLVWHYGGAFDDATADKTGRKYVFGRTISSCAIHDGLLYIGEVAGFVHCLDAKTGQPHWVYDTKAEIWGSPLWVDGKVYIGTGDGDIHILQHGKAQKLVGKVEMNDGAIYSTPVVVNGVLYVMTMKSLWAIGNKDKE
jgi:outer membrane protein assembly factor BamB